MALPHIEHLSIISRVRGHTESLSLCTRFVVCFGFALRRPRTSVSHFDSWGTIKRCDELLFRANAIFFFNSVDLFIIEKDRILSFFINNWWREIKTQTYIDSRRITLTKKVNIGVNTCSGVCPFTPSTTQKKLFDYLYQCWVRPRGSLKIFNVIE